MTTAETFSRICPLCEATCGIKVTVEGDRILSVRGNPDDPFSRGYICPKGVALPELHHDPARLRTPLVRRSKGGDLEPADWDEAFAVIRERLGSIIREHGPNSVAVFAGNPNVHSPANTFYLPALFRGLGTDQRYSASTVDQMPKQVASALMFGTEFSVPIPDIDRTDLFVILGANPLVSNGSLMTAPDMPGRLRALKKRGGRLVVIDPVRTRTAQVADVHLPIRPGSDALLLASLARELIQPGVAHLGSAAAHIDSGELDVLRQALEPFTPEAVAPITGIEALAIRTLIDDLRAAPSAAVYGRMGTSTSGLNSSGRTLPLATVASWLVDVVNVAIGALDSPGGVMWPRGAAGGPNTVGTPGKGRGVRIPGSRRSRVRGLPSALGEFPASVLAEEIDTPDPETGERVRALVTVAGNPVLSTPDSQRLAAAIGQLEFMVSVDAYLNDTTSRADVILPAPSPLSRPHFDVVFNNLAVRNQARFAPPTMPLADTERSEADTLLQLAAIAIGITTGSEPTADQLDDVVAGAIAHQSVSDEASSAHGADIAEVLAAVSHLTRVRRLLDLRIRSGPYGDGFGQNPHPEALSLTCLEDRPDGIDLGPLQPRLPEVLRTPSGRIDVAPPILVEALDDLSAFLASADSAPDLVLVGRRQLRSNNSWMHTLPALQGGSNVCTVLMNPQDAVRLGISDGRQVTLRTTTGATSAPVHVTDEVMPGVVSMPHGWSGANVNAVVGTDAIDPLSATAVLSGIPVTVSQA